MKRLENLAFFNKDEGVSRLIAGILDHLTPLLEKDHQKAERKMREYKFVSQDLTETREHVYVELPRRVYRFLKLMHQD